MVFKNIGRFAGGFADMLTGDRYDFDRQGSLVGNKPVDFMPEKNIFVEKDDDNKGFLDAFLKSNLSYNPEKNKTESDKLFDAMATRGGSGGNGSFAKIGNNLALYTPDNSARENAILQQNQINAQRAAQAKETKSNLGRMAGTAIGSAFGPLGAGIGGFIGGIFCDIRLKEDIAPLCVSEVNDVLSECAFFVKNLNECS